MTSIDSLADSEHLLRAFLDDCTDRLDDMAEAIETADSDAGAAAEGAWAAVLMRHAHNIKGMGSAFGFPTVTLVAHKFEDYLRGAESFGTLDPRTAEVFVEEIGRIVATGRDPDNAEAGVILRGLPVARMSDFTVEAALSVDALLIGARNLQHGIIARELASAGIRVTAVESPFVGIEMGVMLRPNLIISGAVSKGLAGPDLARAFSVIEATRTTPFLLLTSLPESDAALDGLPPSVRVIRKGASFANDLADFLAETGVI